MLRKAVLGFSSSFVLLSLLALSYALSKASAQAAFEPPVNAWPLEDAKGSVKIGAKCGADGQRDCLILEGSSNSDVHALGPIMPDTMNDASVFLFRAVVKTNGIRLYLGIDGAQFDFTPYATVNWTDPSDGWSEVSAMLRAPEGSSKRIIAGIYQLEGTCYIDKVSLARAEMATVTQDSTYRTLTQGDAVLRNGTFVSNLFVDDYYNTVNPHIKSISARWNTNRAVFTKRPQHHVRLFWHDWDAYSPARTRV